MTTNNSPWIWSKENGDYYMASWDPNTGQPIYQWYKQMTNGPSTQPTVAVSQSAPWPNNRQDSVISTSYELPALSYDHQQLTSVRATSDQPEYIHGTPGRWEGLDSSYVVREGPECQQFFKVGRVFSMLWTEPAGSTSSRNGFNDAYSYVKFGEKAYSNIRRFVVLEVPNNQAFVYACGITTYTNRGVLKDGCNPPDHSAVHFAGTASYIQEEEYQAGMTNEAIEINPAQAGMSMSSLSRINFGKTVAVEKNVKVKDIGRVTPAQMGRLIRYWKKAKGEDADE